MVIYNELGSNREHYIANTYTRTIELDTHHRLICDDIMKEVMNKEFLFHGVANHLLKTWLEQADMFPHFTEMEK